MKLGKNEPGYMVQLDGLRAIAVAIVVLFHWTPEVKQTGLGGLGVQLFFVLSGYLITGILLNARHTSETIGSSKNQIVKNFYARRFLRIFPLYYLVILLAAILGSVNVLQYLTWHLTYLTNAAIFLQQYWIGEASHLWSLAVEEQFYILWPFVILYTPKRYLKATVIGFIILAPLFKLTCAYWQIGGSRIGVLPISSFHYLGAGALLAIVEKSRKFTQDESFRSSFAKTVKLAGIVGLAVFAGFRFFPQVMAFSPLIPIIQEFALICLFISLTMGAAYGFKGSAGAILSSGSMVYLGQISYSLYLLHNFVPYFTSKLLHYIGWNLNIYQELLLYGTILIGLSALSWHFFESKLNKYKKHFPYIKNKKLVAVTNL